MGHITRVKRKVSMTTSTDSHAGSNVVQLQPVKARKVSEEKWGEKVIGLGFSIVPSLLFRAQRRLKLSPTDLAVILQLHDFWWDEKRKPYPSKQTLADRLSLSERQVQRIIARLEKEGFLERVERRGRNGGKISNVYDLSGLVAKLKALEPEFREVEERAKAERRAITRMGGRTKVKAPA
jgi:predicted transcriptional regulator